MCAFREQEDDQATLLLPRVARAQKIIRLHPFLSSASKEVTWPLPAPPSAVTDRPLETIDGHVALTRPGAFADRELDVCLATHST